nr:retrovirus-related Pol polyprotein from transposon TNT 1-94 [Tanacetum cinerariifolium]
WKMAMLSIDFDKKESARFNKKKRYSSFKIKEIGKKEEDSKALITVDTLVDWTDHDDESDGVNASKEFGMIAGCDTEDAIEESAAKIYNLITGADTEEASTAGDAGEFTLMGVTSEVHNCPFGCDNKYNELHKHYNELNEKNSDHFIQVQAYKNSLKTLEKQKRVLQRNQLTFIDKIRVLSIKLENTSNLLKHSERLNANVETAKKDLQTKLNNHLVETEKWRNSSKNLFRLIDSSMSVRTKVGLEFNNYIRENDLGWDNSAFSVCTTNSEDVEGRPLFYVFAKVDSIKVVPPPLSGDYTSLSDHSDLDESQMSYGTKSLTSNDSKSVSNDFVSCDDSDKSSEVNTNNFASSDSSVKSLEPKPNDSTSCASTFSVSTSEHEAEIKSNVGTPIQEPIIVQDLPSFFCNSFDTNENTSRTSCNKNGYFNKKACHFRKHASSVSKTGKVTIPPARPHLVPTNRGYSPSENPFLDVEDEGVFDSGCSRSMTGNKERLDDFQTFQGGKVTFGGGEGRITGKGTIQTPMLDFENVYYVKNCNNSTCSLSLRFMTRRIEFSSQTLSVLCYPRTSSFQMKVWWFCWVFFLEHKDAAYPILRDFINLVENQLNKKVKAIRCDNGTEFKNAYMIKLYVSKGIKREYSNASTPQQNRVAERKNKTLIEAARTMLADSKLPTMFWTEAVRTACYVLNRVLVTSPHNKTPYALLTGNIPSVGHFKPFGCHVTILNISDHLGKFDEKADEGYIVGYSASNKAYRVYNVPNKRVEESMNLRFLKEKPNVQGLDSDCNEQVIIVPSYPSHNIQGPEPKVTSGDEVDDSLLNFADEIFQKELARLKGQEQKATSDAMSLGLGFANDAVELQKNASAKTVPSGSIPVPIGYIPVPAGATMVSTDDVPVHTRSLSDSFFDDEPTTRFPCPSDLGNHDPSPGIFSSSSYDDEFGAALTNIASTVEVSLVAFEDPSWVDAMQEEMQQFKFQNVWVLVDLPA